VPLVLGLASLAATTRVEVRDADDGRLVATGSARHPGVDPASTPAEQQVEVWWDGLVDAIAAAGPRRDVVGLAVTGQRGAVVLVDAIGTPLAPASLRGDRRAAGLAAELVGSLGAGRLARATGQRPLGDSALARLVRLLASDGDLAAGIDGVLGAANTLTARLTSRRVTDRSGASSTGWWDPAGERWRTDLLARVARPAPAAGWSSVLPAVLGPAEPADSVSANIHAVAGLAGRPLVAAGTVDVAARALAAGVHPGAVAALLDEREPVVVACTTTPVADPSGRISGLADATGHYLPTLPIGTVGPMLDGVARLLGTDPVGLATRASAAARRGGWQPPSVVAVPAMSAGPDAARPAGLLHVDGDTTPGELAWAALLGAAAEVLAALDALDGVGGGEPDGGPVVLAGVVARRPGLAAAVAELAGREVVVVGDATPAAGACVQAAAAVGGTSPLEVARAWGLGTGDVVEPVGQLDAGRCLAAHAAARLALQGEGPV
jgi:xylulokinase